MMGIEGQDGAGGNVADALLGGAAGGQGSGQAAGEGEGQGEQGGGGQGDGGAAPDWHAGLSAEADGDRPSNRDWIAAKGFRDVDGLVKAYRSAEQALHDGGRVKIPGEGATPEEVTAYRKAIGVPDDVAGYELKAPVGEDGQPIAMVDGVLDRIAAIGHKHGAPKGLLEAIVADYIQSDLDGIAAHQREQDAQAAAWMKAQGAGATEKVAAINRAAEALVLNRDDVAKLRTAWGAEKALNVMAKLGAGIAEDRTGLSGGGPARFGVSGERAQSELKTLQAQPGWIAKALTKGSPENLHYLRLNDAIADWEERKARA